MNIFQKLIYARLLLAASYAIGDGNYDGAESKVDAIFKLFKSEKPSSVVSIQANIMCALVAWNQSKFDLSFRATRVALDKIAVRLRSDARDKDEFLYLRAYCKSLVYFSEEKSETLCDIDFSDIKNLPPGGINMNNVRRTTREMFPLDDTFF